MPNLLQELSTVTVTSDTSPSESGAEASNLITNLGNRSPIDDFPIEGVDGALANYKSCFKVIETQISSLSDLFIFGVDLGDVYFQHSILIVQALD